VIHRVLDNGMDMDQAIQFGRVHNQIFPDKTYVDPLRVSPDTEAILRKMGHKIQEEMVAKVYGVRENSEGRLEAAFDSRGEGAAGGL
jgi:gamma-glutamyltranspeptidase